MWAIEPDTCFSTSVLSSIEFCTGGALYSGWGTGGTFYAHPLLYANPAPPGDSPLYIGLGTSIQLTPHAYCNEAYVYVEGRFVLGSRCPPNLQIWNPINSGDPLSDALDADCQIWATAVAPGSAEITLTGEDTWGRQRDLPEPLEYQIVEMDIDLAGLADELDMTLPGKGIGLNSDDDDDDSVVDLVDSYVAGEDELVSMQVTARGADCPYRYRFCFGANVRIWRDSSKGGPPLVSGELLAPGDHPSSLHVEAVASGNGAITGELWIDPDQDGSWEAIHSDLVVYTVCEVDLVATTIDPLGLVVSVNWSDDDGDGWTNEEAPPDAVYTPDKDDEYILNGDNDFRTVVLWASPTDLDGATVRITPSGGIKVYRSSTKRMGLGSSEVAPGTEIPVSELPLALLVEGLTGSESFADEKLTAEYKWQGDSLTHDELPVTVVEVTLGGVFSGLQQEDNEIRFNSEGWQISNDRNGLISWDDADGDGQTGDVDTHCRYFHNCMECRGTVSPQLASIDPQPIEFSFFQQMQKLHAQSSDGVVWLCDPTTNPPMLVTTWTDDGPNGEVQDVSISEQGHIYTLDGPGPIELSGPHLMVYLNFRVRVMVNIGGSWHQCSDYFKWHSEMLVEPVPGTELRTRGARAAQKLGSGWIQFPEAID